MAKATAQDSDNEFKVTLPLSSGIAGEIIAVVIVVGLILIMSGDVPNNRLREETIIVMSGSVIGYLAGYSSLGMAAFTFSSQACKNNMLSVAGDSQHKHGLFLTITASITGLYIILYYFSLRKFLSPESMMFRSADGSFEWPVNPLIAVITAITLGFLGFFSVRYAAYVRLTKLLELSLKSPRDKEVVKVLHAAVFKGEQLYEPAGNIFVTVGLIATFLGLAASLIAVDLPGLLNASNSVASNSSAPADSGASGISALKSFVGCMGLALGVSMLGVMTALASQWLRGHGAAECTEDLLSRARSVPKPAVKATAGPNAAPPTPAPPSPALDLSKTQGG